MDKLCISHGQQAAHILTHSLPTGSIIVAVTHSAHRDDYGYCPFRSLFTLATLFTINILLFGLDTGPIIMPGILLALMIMAVIWIWMKINPSIAPAGESCAWSERFKSLKGIIGVLLIFLITLGGMFVGFFTVNEAAAIGAFLSLVAMVVRRKMTLKNLAAVMKNTIKTSAMIFLLLLGATVFGSFLMISRLPTTFAAFVSSLDVSRYVILAFIFVIYAFLGCLMDAVPMMLITLPIFYPVVTGLGFDGIWFGAFMVLVVELGFVTPPVGMNCYVVNGLMKNVGLPNVFKGTAPFLLSVLATILLCTIFPGIATWLPSIMK